MHYEPMVLVACKPMAPIVLVGLPAMAIHFLQAGRKRATLPGAEASMTTTIEFITALSYGSPIFKVVQQKRCKALYTALTKSPKSPEYAGGEGSERSNVERSVAVPP